MIVEIKQVYKSLVSFIVVTLLTATWQLYQVSVLLAHFSFHGALYLHSHGK